MGKWNDYLRAQQFGWSFAHWGDWRMCSGVRESSQFRQCLNHFIYHSNQTDIYDLITNNQKESKTMAEVRQCTQKKRDHPVLPFRPADMGERYTHRSVQKMISCLYYLMSFFLHCWKLLNRILNKRYAELKERCCLTIFEMHRQHSNTKYIYYNVRTIFFKLNRIFCVRKLC